MDSCLLGSAKKRDTNILISIRDEYKAKDKTKEKSPESQLYCDCMGLYRRFLEGQGSHLQLDGLKAKRYKEAMDSIIAYMRSLASAKGSENIDKSILAGVEKLFTSWHFLNDYHRHQIGLPEIYKHIVEIIPQIRNGGANGTAISDEYKGKVFRDLYTAVDARVNERGNNHLQGNT